MIVKQNWFKWFFGWLLERDLNMGNGNWGYYMGQEEGGRKRICNECNEIKVEYWHNHKTNSTVCGKCADGMKPGEDGEIYIKRKEITCQHCGKKTGA